MALRTIREYGDPVLTKKAKPIKEMTPKIEALIKDMLETLYDSGGVGLAAPQVGMLKRLVVIDISEEQNEPHILINPEIIESDGEQKGLEGCLSVPGKSGIVTRPNHVKVRALNEKMEPIEIEGVELMARAICHELDHLEGKVYVDLVEGELYDNDDLVPVEDDEDEAADMDQETEVTNGEA